MNKNSKFRYSTRPIPVGEALTFAEIEARCLKQLQDKDGKCVQSLKNLADLYSRVKRHDEACDCIRQLIALSDEPEEHARCCLSLGCLMEHIRDYGSAVKYYRQAFGMEPCSTQTWYFIHNNLGFSLNQLGRYDEAIPYLSHALKIDPDRPNAYKNLGLAFVAKGRFAEAAELFVTATQVEASDSRSLAHLESLILAHPGLEVEVPDLRDRLEGCREAVKFARAHQPDLRAAWKRDRRKQKRK